MAVRMPAVAGSFYPADPDALREEVEAHLRAVAAPVTRLRAVVTPHAGHVYSGGLAALALSHLALEGARRIVLVGPSHHVWLDDAACVPTHDAWATPLGELRIDVPEDVSALTGVVAHDVPHAREHSLEVQLPFLQALLGGADVPICPVVVSRNPRLVADVLAVALADPGTVVAVSSDLSHYLPYDEAVATDAETLAQVVALDGELESERACGAAAVSGLMAHARATGARLVELGRCNSGDTAGGRDRVVGYAALALEEER